jgi:hypothetical protein
VSLLSFSRLNPLVLHHTTLRTIVRPPLHRNAWSCNPHRCWVCPPRTSTMVSRPLEHLVQHPSLPQENITTDGALLSRTSAKSSFLSTETVLLHSLTNEMTSSTYYPSTRCWFPSPRHRCYRRPIPVSPYPLRSPKLSRCAALVLLELPSSLLTTGWPGSTGLPLVTTVAAPWRSPLLMLGESRAEPASFGPCAQWVFPFSIWFTLIIQMISNLPKFI